MHHRTIQINHEPDATIFQAGRPARPRTQHDCHHDTKVKAEAATAVIELLMMGGKTLETCWAVNKSQDNKLENCCIWLVIYLNVEFVSDRMSRMVLKGHWLNIIVLNWHARIEEKSEDTKDHFMWNSSRIAIIFLSTMWKSRSEISMQKWGERIISNDNWEWESTSG